MTHAPKGATALQYGRTIPFDLDLDLDLTDLGLTDGSGIEIGRELGTRMPVVALSGYGAVPTFATPRWRASPTISSSPPSPLRCTGLQRAVECHRAPA